MTRLRQLVERCGAALASLAAACVCLGADAPTPAPSPASDDGAALFDRARLTWAREAYPALLDYTVVVTIASDMHERADRYTGEVQSATGEFRVSKFSLAEVAHPHEAHGINVTWQIAVGFSSGAAPVGGKAIGSDGLPLGGIHIPLSGYLAREAPIEPYAIPEVSPLYAFGMLTCASRVVRGRDDTGLRTIGGTTTTTRRYRIRIVGTETVDGAPTMHLALVPLVDPGRDRLRDLWIDPATFVVVQARIAGNFLGKSEASVPWLVHFTTRDGATYVDTETSEGPIRRGRNVFDRVTIAFTDVAVKHGSPSFGFALPPDFADLNYVAEPPEPRSRSCMS